MTESYVGLLDISEELFYNIATYLPVKDIVSLLKTNTEVRKNIDLNNRLWKTLIERDFRLVCKNCEGSLKTLYILLARTYCVDTDEFDLEK